MTSPTAGRRPLELLTALAFASAAVLWGVAVFETTVGNDAFAPLVLGDLGAIACFVMGAIVARSWIAVVAAVLSAPYFVFDAVLRALGGALATDGARPVPAYILHPGNGSAVYPALASLLILALAFALRRRVPIVWLAGAGVALAVIGFALLGRDAAMLFGIWYAIAAIGFARSETSGNVDRFTRLRE